VQFSGCRYFGESRKFFKRNWCKLMTVTLMWGVIFLGLGCAIHRIQPTPVHAGWGMNWGGKWNGNEGGNWNGNEGGNWNGDDSMPGTNMPTPDQNPQQPPQPPVMYDNTPNYPYSDERMAPQQQIAEVPQGVRCKMLLQLALMFLVGILIAMPALAGIFAAVFNAMRTNAPIRYKDFFSGFCCRYYCRLIPLSLTLKLLTGILSILIIPGLWFAFVTIFAVPLHREHKFLGTCRSICVSIKIVHRYFCRMLLFLILNGLLQVLGLFLFGVGLLVTIPLSLVALCYCYNDLIGVNGMPMILVAQPLPGIGVATVV